MIRLLPALIAALLSLVLVLGPTLAQTAGFVESFDGSPAQPADYMNPHNWDFMVLGVDQREPNVAQHGPDCETPGFPYTASNTHPFSTANQAVFLCNNHLMTAPGIAGYGAIYMTPPAVADFSQGSARISWDMSTLRTSSRDWVYVTLTPFSEHHEMPYLNTDQHIPPHNIKIALGGVDTFEVFQNGGFQNSRLDGTDLGTSWDDVFAAQTPPAAQSPIRRDTFEITLSRSTISLCMPNYTWRGVQPFCWARNVALREPLDPAVWGDQATVQFTHVVYNAEKSCETEALLNGYTGGKQPGDPRGVLDQFDIVHNAWGDLHCPPNTWHWDNVSINPAVPYVVVPSVPADASSNSGRASRIAFGAAAPAGAFLSFVSWGDTPQLAVSFDGGATWLPPHFQEATAFAHPEVGENVFMPIPAGQQSVMVRGANGYWGGFEAQAFKIVSPPNRSIPTVLPTPTHSPTAVVSPISTQTAAPRPTSVFATDTPMPQEGATETPTPTLVATPTVGPPVVKPTPEATPVVPGGVCALSITIRDNRLVVEPTPCS